MDTNVLVSGIFFSGAPFQILNAWQQQKLLQTPHFTRIGTALEIVEQDIDTDKIMSGCPRDFGALLKV